MENSPRRLLFISKGKLLPHHHHSLTGFLRIEDACNLATIEGHFTHGHCPSATIYSQKLYIISDVSVQIEEKGDVRIYGNEVKEIYQIGKDPSFVGSYRGYSKYGRGVYFVEQNGKDYENEGFWSGGRQNGLYAKTHVGGSEEQNTYQYCEFTDGELVDGIRIVKEGSWILEQGWRIRTISEEEKESKVSEQREKLNDWIKKCESEMPASIADGYISAKTSTGLSVPQRYRSKNALDSGSMLDGQFCEMYLAYLARSPLHQQQSQTAIISLETTIILGAAQKAGEMGQQEKELKRLEILSSTQFYMRRYWGQYHLFSSSWNRVIFPIVKTHSKYKHFLFAAVTIQPNPMVCTFYNSLPSIPASEYASYFQCFKFFLQTYTERQIANHLNQMTWQVSPTFPSQNDNYSCGVFMLQGISDLMRYGEVQFDPANLSVLKRQLINDLQLLGCS